MLAASTALVFQRRLHILKLTVSIKIDVRGDGRQADLGAASVTLETAGVALPERDVPD